MKVKIGLMEIKKKRHKTCLLVESNRESEKVIRIWSKIEWEKCKRNPCKEKEMKSIACCLLEITSGKFLDAIVFLRGKIHSRT